MPEPYWPKRKHSYRLSDAEENSRYGRIWCRYCKQEKFFLLRDLRTAFGNIECDDVLYQRRWHCTGCNKSHTLDFELRDPPVSGGVTVRRLVKVEYIRRPVWRDEPL